MPGSVLSETANTSGGGFFGKVPSHGDYVARDLPRAFVDPWHNWLERVLGATRQALGEAWLDAYLTGPVWCFGLAAGVCGASPMAGVMIPSVDKVGRYFPFTLAYPLAPDVPIAELPTAAAWFDAAEALALGMLSLDADIEALRMRTRELGKPRVALAAAATAARTALAGDLHARLLDQVPQERHGAYALWWTAGSPRVGPGMFGHSGLPEPDMAVAMLDGDWPRWGWNGAASRVDLGEWA